MNQQDARTGTDPAVLAGVEALAAADRDAATENFEDRLFMRTQSIITATAPAPRPAARPAWRERGRLAASLALVATAAAMTLLAIPKWPTGGGAQLGADVLAASLEADLAPLLAETEPWADDLSTELLLLEIESALLDDDLEPDWGPFFDGAAS